MTFALLKIGLTLFVVNILMLSSCHACTPYVKEFDKFLCALTISDLKGQVLRLEWSR